MTNKQTDTILNVLHLIPEHILIQQILVLESTDLTYYIASAKHTVSSLLQRKFKGIQQAYFAQHLQELKQLTQEELTIRLTALLQEKLNLSTPNKNEITKALACEAAQLYPHIASRTISDNYKLDLIAQQFAIDSREKLRKQNNEEARHTEQLIDNYLTAMSDEDKLQLFHTFKPDVLNGAGIRKALIATGIPLGLQSLSSFGMYYAPATILHAVFTTALGITLPFVVYTSTVTLMSVLTGPIGWTLASGGWGWQLYRSHKHRIRQALAQFIYLLSLCIPDSFSQEVIKMKANRSLTNPELRHLFNQTLLHARHEVDILSPWISEPALYKWGSTYKLIQRALERGITVKIAYGMGSLAPGPHVKMKDIRTHERALQLYHNFKDYPNFHIHKVDSHFKLFISDNDYYVTTSLNVLSNFYHEDNLHEGGEVSRNRHLLEEYRQKYFSFTGCTIEDIVYK